MIYYAGDNDQVMKDTMTQELENALCFERGGKPCKLFIRYLDISIIGNNTVSHRRKTIGMQRYRVSVCASRVADRWWSILLP